MKRTKTLFSFLPFRTPSSTFRAGKSVMRILIADDDTVSRTILERTLRGWGHEVVTVPDGLLAWKVLCEDEAPRVAILDWMMPGLEGPEVCRRVRELVRPIPTYLILLTSKDATGDVVAGLESGADDYVTKPFDRAELQSRIKVGERMIALQQRLADRVRELEESLIRVKQLQGLLPICAWCKNVRNDGNYWQSVEVYIAEHADVRFTHGICPPCLAREVGE
jgi:sigma-B regulation protein RsbU (phosphoserine phosphatase)